MKLSALIFFLMSLLNSNAFAAGGSVLICATEDNEIKITADLPYGGFQQDAIISQEGVKVRLTDSTKKNSKHHFSYQIDKNTPLLIQSQDRKTVEAVIKTNPEKNGLQVLHDVKEPSLLKITKFKANLTYQKFEIIDEEVSCTETKWQN